MIHVSDLNGNGTVDISEHVCPYSPLITDGLDDNDVVSDELLIDDLDENQLLDCWEHLDEFPFDPESKPPPDDAAKKRAILDLLVKLAKNPNRVFGVNVPTC